MIALKRANDLLHLARNADPSQLNLMPDRMRSPRISVGSASREVSSPIGSTNGRRTHAALSMTSHVLVETLIKSGQTSQKATHRPMRSSNMGVLYLSKSRALNVADLHGVKPDAVETMSSKGLFETKHQMFSIDKSQINQFDENTLHNLNLHHERSMKPFAKGAIHYNALNDDRVDFSYLDEFNKAVRSAER